MTPLTDFETKKHYCVVELLPGVYNKTSIRGAFAQVR